MSGIMNTSELIGLMVAVFGGFTTLTIAFIAGVWKISSVLTEIKVSLEKKVTYAECSEKRDKCPCVVAYYNNRTPTGRIQTGEIR